MADSRPIIELIAERIARDDFKLPVFNPVALEIQQTIEQDADLEEVEKLILKDQAIASEILRVANSSFFAGLSKLQNIRQALARLGVNRVFSLVMIATQKQAFRARNPFLASLMVRLWQHAVASAGACRWVAVKAGYGQLAESAFLAGLLHDLGSLVNLQVMDEVAHEPAMEELTEGVIQEVIDTTHTGYGFQIMQRWNLPEEYALAARDHHLENPDHPPLIQIVRLVDAACKKVGIGLTRDPGLVLETMPEALVLGIKDVHLAELEIELEEMIHQFG
jgi:HD-like signal output (HDOD) protein